MYAGDGESSSIIIVSHRVDDVTHVKIGTQ